MILLVITTLNQNEYTRALLESIHSTDTYKKGQLDILIVDDYSQEDNVKKLAKEFNATFIGKDKPYGLTDSWNRAYHHYKNNLYNNLYIANNDILIPRGCIKNIEQLLIRFHSVSPLCNPKGIGNWAEIQQYDVTNQCKISKLIADVPAQFNTVQSLLIPYRHQKTDFFHGFLMCFTRDILTNELPDGNLFNPSNVNVGNEIELNMRFKGKKGIALGAFIYHYKGITLNRKNRNILEQFH